jgi:hypothetical protein
VTDAAAGQAIPVTLTNTHVIHAAAFKFRTNAPTRYTVKPVTGVIAPGGSVTVQSTSRPTHKSISIHTHTHTHSLTHGRAHTRTHEQSGGRRRRGRRTR